MYADTAAEWWCSVNCRVCMAVIADRGLVIVEATLQGAQACELCPHGSTL
jgi:hypothetical protein